MRGFLFSAIHMLGSPRKTYTLPARGGAQLFRVTLVGRVLWGWERRSSNGRIIERSAHLFPDYVSCLCDAERRY
jgi:hypothetical protein